MLARACSGLTGVPAPFPGMMLSWGWSFVLVRWQSIKRVTAWRQAVLVPALISRVFTFLPLRVYIFAMIMALRLCQQSPNCIMLCCSMSGQYPTITGYRKSGTI